MRRIIRLYSIFSCTVVLALCLSCSNTTPTPAPIPPTLKKGLLLFWTNNLQRLQSCGPTSVKLNTGQQTNITIAWTTVPTSCINQYGGSIIIDEGTYTYQVITAYGCTIPGATVKVIGDQCNMVQIQL